MPRLPGPWPARWAALVLLAALTGLAVRLVWIDARLSGSPRPGRWRDRAPLEAPLARAPWNHDEQLFYLSTAVNAFNGRGFFPDYNKVRDGVYVPPPLQSLLILSVFGAAGRLVEPFTLLALQACIASLMIVLAAELGRRLVSRPAGVLCALLIALHPDLVLWSGYLLTEGNYAAGVVLLTILAVLWAETPSAGRALAVGLTLGLLNLQRPNAILLPPVLALWALARLGARRGSVSALVLLLVPLAVMLPWRQRNLAVYGEPIWVSSNLGVYLYMSNNPKLDVLETPYVEDANSERRMLLPRIETRLRAPEDRRLQVSYYEYSKAYLSALGDYVGSRPLHFAGNYAAKLVAQLWFVPPSGRVPAMFGIPAAVYAAAQRALIAAGLAGLAATLWLRPSRAAATCAVLLAYFIAAGALAGLDRAGRYTLIVRLLLLVFFATGLASLTAGVWESPRRERSQTGGTASDPGGSATSSK